MKKAIFTIDCHPSYYVGYTNGLRWNGWEMPLFDKKTVNRILAELTSEECDSTFHWEGETLIETDHSEGESYPVYSTMIDGEMHYQVGNGWIWEEERGIEGAVFVKDLSGLLGDEYEYALAWAMSNIEDSELVEWLTSAGVGDEYTTNNNKRIEIIK